MNREYAERISFQYLIPECVTRYALSNYMIRPVAGHAGGRNLAYVCDKEGAEKYVLRIAYLPDRNESDLMAETEWISYLRAGGAGVIGVVPSKSGKAVETLTYNGYSYYACLFTWAKGEQLADKGYRYRPGAPLTEYFFNCGKTIGKIHALTKAYTPVHRRQDFFEKYNARAIRE